MNLALFDFDGTITTEDTYTKFIFFATPKLRLIIGLCVIFPVIVLYKLKMLRAAKTRPILSMVAFWLRNTKHVQDSAARFVAEYIPSVTRKEMVEKIQWHTSQGDDVYVVSASLDPYLEIWCKQLGIKLVCSKLEVSGDKYTGAYVNGDCSEERKVTGIKQATDLSQYSKVYMYGDTAEDLPLLSIADVKFYKGRRLGTQ